MDGRALESEIAATSSGAFPHRRAGGAAPVRPGCAGALKRAGGRGRLQRLRRVAARGQRRAPSPPSRPRSIRRPRRPQMAALLQLVEGGGGLEPAFEPVVPIAFEGVVDHGCVLDSRPAKDRQVAAPFNRNLPAAGSRCSSAASTASDASGRASAACARAASAARAVGVGELREGLGKAVRVADLPARRPPRPAARRPGRNCPGAGPCSRRSRKRRVR